MNFLSIYRSFPWFPVTFQPRVSKPELCHQAARWRHGPPCCPRQLLQHRCRHMPQGAGTWHMAGQLKFWHQKWLKHWHNTYLRNFRNVHTKKKWYKMYVWKRGLKTKQMEKYTSGVCKGKRYHTSWNLVLFEKRIGSWFKPICVCMLNMHRSKSLS